MSDKYKVQQIIEKYKDELSENIISSNFINDIYEDVDYDGVLERLMDNGFDIFRNIEKLPAYFFSYSDYLSQITVPKKFKCVSEYFCYNCTNLKSVSIEQGVEEIHPHSFEGCDNLEYIRLPKSIRYVAISAFSRCPMLKDLHYEGTEEDWENVDVIENSDLLKTAKISFNS